jgi:hypothetical protein
VKNNSELFNDIQKYMNEAPAEREEYILFTEDEYNQIILNFLKGRGEQGADEEEVLEIIRWAERVKVDETFLSLFMKGFIVLDFKDGEPVVKQADNPPPQT